MFMMLGQPLSSAPLTLTHTGDWNWLLLWLYVAVLYLYREYPLLMLGVLAVVLCILALAMVGVFAIAREVFRRFVGQ